MQTLKRQAEDNMNFNNDDIDENEFDSQFDVTWGCKKSRSLYSYTLQSPDLFPNPNQTEIGIAEKPRCSRVGSYCGSECDFKYGCSSLLNHSEFESPPSISFGSSESYVTDRDPESLFPDTNICPAIYTKCCHCKRKNENTSFQYCTNCFTYRMKLFDSNPDPQPRTIRKLNKILNKINQDSSGENITDNKSEHTLNVCNICFIREKNGIFNHGRTGHIYSCYSCSKRIWARLGKCPICNTKIRNVTKAIKV